MYLKKFITWCGCCSIVDKSVGCELCHVKVVSTCMIVWCIPFFLQVEGRVLLLKCFVKAVISSKASSSKEVWFTIKAGYDFTPNLPVSEVSTGFFIFVLDCSSEARELQVALRQTIWEVHLLSVEEIWRPISRLEAVYVLHVEWLCVLWTQRALLGCTRKKIQTCVWMKSCLDWFFHFRKAWFW